VAATNADLNIRVSKLYQGAEWGALEVAFNSAPECAVMMSEIARETGLFFERPPANLLALREIHIAEVGGEDVLEAAFVRVSEIAARYGEVHDSQKNMKGPNEFEPGELDRQVPGRP
jgi:hypothetical protein